MAKLISKVYGEALFELALEKQSIDELFEEAKAIREIFKDNTDLNLLMTHPKIGKEEKIEAVKAIFDGRVSKDMTGFLVLIVEKGRAGELDAVLEYFLSQVKEYKKIGVVYVTSAMELSADQKAKTEKRILDTTDYSELEMHYKTDAALIGGLVIRIGDRVVDKSIRTQLANMENELQKIQLS